MTTKLQCNQEASLFYNQFITNYHYEEAITKHRQVNMFGLIVNPLPMTTVRTQEMNNDKEMYLVYRKPYPMTRTRKQ